MKKNTKKNNNDKLIKIILISLVALVLIIVIAVISKKIVKNTVNADLMEPVVEAVNSSYLLNYLLYADVKVSEGYMINDLGTYYYVNDEVLKDIKNLEDIYKLIQNSYPYVYESTYIERLNNKEYNRYLEVDGNLYVAKKEQPCKELLTFDKEGVSYKSEGKDKLYISWKTEGIHAEVDDGKVKLLNDVFYCKDSI